eukprot:m.186567 g.186567  ORF g.186567 m.186567 type:complete len:646 (-) comp15057_c0_seq1:222-2159(-)
MDRGQPQRLKLVVVGDGAVGKSCLLLTYTGGVFPEHYCPTVFENYVADATYDGQAYEISLWDTAGQEDYDRIRPLSYPDTDVVFVCFSVDSRDSIENVHEKWLPELQHFLPKVPVVLVGLKVDLPREVTREEGEAMATKLKLAAYCEASAKTGMNVQGTLSTAVKAALENPKKKISKWSWFGIGKSRDSENLKNPEPTPPELPKAGNAPWIYPLGATLATDFGRSGRFQGAAQVDDPTPDVQIIVGGHAIEAHSTILVAASAQFEQRLTAALRGPAPTQPPVYSPPSATAIDTEAPPSNPRDTAPPQYTPIAGAAEKSSGQLTTIRLADAAGLTARGVQNVIEWLYAGDCHRLPGRVSADEISRRGAAVAERKFTGTADDDQVLKETETAAEALGCTELVTYVQNIREGHHVLNVSFSTYVMDQTGNRAGRLLLGSDLLADITLELDDGARIPAHEALLAIRCKALKPLLAKSDQPDGFGRKRVKLAKMTRPVCMAVLEFIYRDHLDFDGGETADIEPLVILQHAHDLGLQRLVTLCELRVTKLVDQAISESIRGSKIDVIGILNVAATHSGQQLENWCLHFISTNFWSMQQRAEWAQLTRRHCDHVTKHQWPPLSYNKDVEKYEADLAAWEKTAKHGRARKWLW